MVPKGVSKFRQTVVGKLEAEKAKRTPLSQEMFGKLVDGSRTRWLRIMFRDPLVSRLKGLHQPVVRSRIRFSAPHSRLLACV